LSAIALDQRPAGGTSAYRAAEWAMTARAKGNTKAASAWDEAERNGWDDHHFSLMKREELAQKWPGSFGPNLEFRGAV
jgi:hypothetical protein